MRNKKKINLGKIFILALLFFITLYGVKGLITSTPNENPPSTPTITSYSMPRTTPTSSFVTPVIKYELGSELSVSSTNAILLLFNSNNEVLYEKNSTEIIYPASMTKIMTAIVAIENINDLNGSITLSEKMYPQIYETNATVAGFLQNEKVQAIDLLYGLMLPSGAECAIGLAEYVAGSENAFADLMNDKAQELGMNDTNFVNATGLHNDKHYSTVRDIAILLEYALDNDVFYKVFTTVRYSSKATNVHPDGITFCSTMFSRMENTEFNGVKILGGKTGYTTEAGQCLASLAEKDGVRFILVTCGAPGNNTTQKLHIDDALMVYDAIRSDTTE